MAQKKKLFHRFRLVYRRSSTLLKCAVLAAIILSAVALITIRASILNAQREEAALRSQAASLEQENQQLAKNISQLGTIESIRYIAMHQLGLVDPDSEFFIPTE